MTENLHSLKRVIIVAIICLIMATIFAGCKPALPSIFSTSTCKPPCWQNIEPGKSSKQEVLSKLKAIPNIDPNSITTHGEHWLIFDDIVYFTLQDQNINGEVNILDGKVSMIVFSGDLNITFSKAIEELGEPKYIINVPMDSGPPGMPTSSSAIIALQPERGIEVAYNTKDLPKSSRAEIKPEIKIRLIILFDPGVYDDLLQAGIFSMELMKGNETQKYMTPWTGYGDISKKYPPAIIK